MEDWLYKELGNNILYHRDINHMSRKELADKAGIPESVMEKIEKGEEPLSYSVFIDIMNVLNTTADALVYDSGRRDIERINVAKLKAFIEKLDSQKQKNIYKLIDALCELCSQNNYDELMSISDKEYLNLTSKF